MELLNNYIEYVQTKYGGSMAIMIEWANYNVQECIAFERMNINDVMVNDVKQNDSKIEKMSKEFKKAFPFVKQPKVILTHIIYIIAHS